ncbi:MAG: hypothetical protein M3A44_12105 [Gammaproteobacteria bacterium]
MAQEFLKSTFATKPKITQDIETPDISARFVVDMSAIPYTGAAATSTPAIVTNTVNLLSSSSGGSFDVVAGGQKNNVTAGSFTWTPGTGFGQSNGTYNYTDGNFNINAIDWKAAYEPGINTCWSYKQNPGSAPCTP